ncbi:type I glyceraldehyde-3-phosphate dehydrogenase [bacterium (Candidatus Torokbacteria) CG_4_10_14_0_2_um_filter_35_8]|nr:MAG: type I glyceraldehyde-3-phosphate dehydrogenase [bacterium (Candidatus Torokbacteria) CG_4_10_14_0_2_um_filter_35_8]
MISKKIKIAINGFGRIGRTTFQRALEFNDIEIVAINDLTDAKTLSYLLKYDSVYGRYERDVNSKKNAIIVDGKEYKILAEKDPERLPWEDLGVDLVLECTGFFTEKEGAGKHLKAGTKKVIISAPSKSEDIPTYLMGVNEEQYNSGKDDLISNGSCTTNCLAPVVKVIDDHFDIRQALMNTIHSYTSTQSIVDSPCEKDFRRGRAAAINLVPTTSGAAKTVGKAIPKLSEIFDGFAVRVPTPCVSLADVTCHITKDTAVEEVNRKFEEASKSEKMKGILAIEYEPKVSSDYIKDPRSAIVDGTLTQMIGKNFLKVISWYDNEWGYSCRLVDMARMVGSKVN